MFHNIAVPVESKEQNLLSDNGINFNTGLLLWEYKVDINWPDGRQLLKDLL